MKRLFKNLFGTGMRETSSVKPQRACVAVEALEARNLMSFSHLLSLSPSSLGSISNLVNPPVRQVSTTLSIRGDARDNQVKIIQDDAKDSITVRMDGVDYQFQRSRIATIDADLGAGNDSFEFDLPSQGPVNLAYSEEIDLHLGDGTNQATFSLGGSIHQLATLQGKLNINVWGGSGADDLHVDFGALNAAQVALTAYMGAGADDVQVNVWGDIQNGSNAFFYLNGGDGDDTMNLWMRPQGTGEEAPIHIDATSAVHATLLGGLGADHLEVRYFGKVDGTLDASACGETEDFWGSVQDGADNISIGIVADPGSTGTIEAFVDGEAGDDTLALNVWNDGNAAVYASIRGGPGADTAEVTDNVTVDPSVETVTVGPSKDNGFAPNDIAASTPDVNADVPVDVATDSSDPSGDPAADPVADSGVSEDPAADADAAAGLVQDPSALPTDDASLSQAPADVAEAAPDVPVADAELADAAEVDTTAAEPQDVAQPQIDATLVATDAGAITDAQTITDTQTIADAQVLDQVFQTTDWTKA